MGRNKNINKVLVIGSGPIIIGQAAEFDYAGTQACRALKEEKISAVLVNSNPATIMTDKDMAERVYLEPLTLSSIQSIIEKERPDSILPTLGGQTGLNMAIELHEQGILDAYNIQLLGTSVEAIEKSEDRELFRDAMQEIAVPTIESDIIHSVEEALTFMEKVGLPLVVRPAYTLGGSGGGIAYSQQELEDIVSGGLRESRTHQCLLEVCVSGYKEIEIEVMRDRKNNCICICDMENIDPVGIHTGDSSVVAPCLTLSESALTVLKDAAKRIISHLKIEGGCNVQFALKPDGLEYYVIEVNPRLSRSSALASKATGYPIAKVATYVALGYTLPEIGDFDGGNGAFFEPKIDYIVAKFPRWPFDKFVSADRKLGTKMKATGEVMSLANTLSAAILKGIRSLELGVYGLHHPESRALSDTALVQEIKNQDDRRLFHVYEALYRGMGIEKVFELTQINRYFLQEFLNIANMEHTLLQYPNDVQVLTDAKIMGYSDHEIARIWQTKETAIREKREQINITPTYFQVDTCKDMLKDYSPYLYSAYENRQANALKPCEKETVVVLGSGPIRIGQGIEFDYCSVHSIKALQKLGYRTVIINSNPETVSTDFDIADTLYFEPMSEEDVLNILSKEKPRGVLVQFGGQTGIKLASAIQEAGYQILGTTLENIDRAEDREQFDALLEELHIPRPNGHTVFTKDAAIQSANEIGYPVLVRPSYVLGGQGMEIAHNDEEISTYMDIVLKQALGKLEHPILIDQYIVGTEVEIDAVCDGKDVLLPGIMEHIERAGVHSGDSISVYPAQNISPTVLQRIQEYTIKLALALDVKGMINIQYIATRDAVYVIEVNPRSSRTVPFISKVTGVELIEIATNCAMGISLSQMGYATGLLQSPDIVAVKVPVFSFDKLPNVEVSLGPEMKSTGEALGLAHSFPAALLKGLLGGGMKLPPKEKGKAILTVAQGDKREVVAVAELLSGMQYDLYATSGTARTLRQHYIGASTVRRLDQGHPNIGDIIDGGVDLIVNTPTHGRQTLRHGFKLRRLAVERRIPCLTSIDTAIALLDAMQIDNGEIAPIALSDITRKEEKNAQD